MPIRGNLFSRFAAVGLLVVVVGSWFAVAESPADNQQTAESLPRPVVNAPY